MNICQDTVKERDAQMTENKAENEGLKVSDHPMNDENLIAMASITGTGHGVMTEPLRSSMELYRCIAWNSEMVLRRSRGLAPPHVSWFDPFSPQNW